MFVGKFEIVARTDKGFESIEIDKTLNQKSPVG